MNEETKLLGNVDLTVTHVKGKNKEGKEFEFDYYSIVLGDSKIKIVPTTENKALFEYLIGKVFKNVK